MGEVYQFLPSERPKYRVTFEEAVAFFHPDLTFSASMGCEIHLRHDQFEIQSILYPCSPQTDYIFQTKVRIRFQFDFT